MTSYNMIEKNLVYVIDNTKMNNESRQMESIVIHRKHQVFLATTYRNLIPRICWTIILQIHWINNRLITKE